MRVLTYFASLPLLLAGAGEDLYKEEKMAIMSQSLIVTSSTESELNQFAGWFHQDSKLVFRDFHEGCQLYLSTISKSRQAELRKQLLHFLNEKRKESNAELRSSWLKLGAQFWQSNLDLRASLTEFANSL